jgi:hypothetical protein
MQIDRYNQPQFPRNNTPVASDNESAGAAPSAGLAKPQGQLPAPALQGQQHRADSVVLKVKFPGGGASQAVRADSAVYTDGRKANTGGDAQVDNESQAAIHQQAVDRNAGIFTQITLSKDGVLVVKPQPGGDAKQPDFVALAVSAMREFSDEAERQKAQSYDFNAPPAEMSWGRVKSLQQLAAKFNVFA